MTASLKMQGTDLVALRERLVLAAGVGVGGIVLLALAHQLVSGQPLLHGRQDVWLGVHLVGVIPALPLGAYVLLRRKGDRLHRMLGRVWAGLMMLAALSGFGLHSLTGGFSWIHLFSILVSITIPRGIVQAMRGNIKAHRRTMTLTYLGLVTAGAFTMVPGRLVASWLFG